MPTNHRQKIAVAHKSHPSTAASSPVGGGTLGVVALALGLAAALICAVMVWAEPRPIGDLYVAFSAGRDILAGKLAKPDEWAFTTTGRVWFNQNYGTHLLHYLAYIWWGQWGIVGMKLFFVAAATAFVALAGRQRGASWAASLIAAGGVIAASRSYVDMRPNLTTLTLAPLMLWLFYMSRRRIHLVWAALAVVVVWSNAHNGFIFSVGLILLWSGLQFLTMMAKEGWTADWHKDRGDLLRGCLTTAWRKGWPLVVASVASVLLANFANPFTYETLTGQSGQPITFGSVFAYILFPFSILAPAWKKLNEWQPMFPKHPIGFGTIWEFFIVTGTLAGLTVLRTLSFISRGGRLREHLTAERFGMFCFDLVLACTLVVMSYKARRFIPLTVIMLGPLVAMQLDWLARSTRPWVLPAVAVALLAPVGHYAWRQYLFYRPDNPTMPSQTIFERMSGVLYMPTGAAQFIADNDISGRILNEWRWEGYLRWACPKVKVFLGGRAHQVYREETDALVTSILWYPPTSAQLLAAQDVHLVALSAEDKYGPLLTALIAKQWSQVYYDGRDTVLVDTQWPAGMDLARRCAEGTLVYPNPTAAAFSRAVCMTTSSLKIPPSKIFDAFLAANAVTPFPSNYRAIWAFIPHSPDGMMRLRSYFRQEFDRLAAMDTNVADGMQIFFCRRAVAEYLLQASRQLGDAPETSRWQKEFQRIQQQMDSVQSKWSLR